MYSEEVNKRLRKRKEKRTERWKRFSNVTIHLNTESVVTLVLLLPQKNAHIDTLTRHRGAEGHKHHSRDRVLQANGASEVRGQVSGDGGQHADEHDGHKEASPAVPVLRGWNEGKQNLPEYGQKVHDVIKTRGQALFATLFFIIIT